MGNSINAQHIDLSYYRELYTAILISDKRIKFCNLTFFSRVKSSISLRNVWNGKNDYNSNNRHRSTSMSHWNYFGNFCKALLMHHDVDNYSLEMTNW